MRINHQQGWLANTELCRTRTVGIEVRMGHWIVNQLTCDPAASSCWKSFSWFLPDHFKDFFWLLWGSFCEVDQLAENSAFTALSRSVCTDLSARICFITDDKMKRAHLNLHIRLESLYLSEKEKIRIFSPSFVPKETRETVIARTKYSEYSFYSLTQLQSLNLYYFLNKASVLFRLPTCQILIA